ncbi:MAG TPA: outer membrane protein assembly factor BamD [bacterium]|nr:outer membrane protein assembly factor BamD [bacterium]
MKIKKISLFLMGNSCVFGYWEWTPETGKWINPKYAVKDTDTQQWEYAESFRHAGNNEAAIREYKKLVKHFPFSEYAPQSLFALAKIYISLGDKEEAFKQLDEIVKKYPDFPDIADVLKMQREISMEMLEKKQLKFIERFKDTNKQLDAIAGVIEIDPYDVETPPLALTLASRYARSGNMEKAIEMYQQVARDFPATKWAEQARYQMLIYEIKNIPAGTTDTSAFSSIETKIDQFIADFPSSPYKEQLLATKKQLRNEIAGRLWKIAEIYKKNGYKKSAEIYYNKIKTEYSDTDYAKKMLSFDIN